MGEQKVNIATDQEELRKFTHSLLKDVKALEFMLENDWFETDPIRMGAEQEMCLISSRTFKPAPIAMEALEHIKYLVFDILRCPGSIIANDDLTSFRIYLRGYLNIRSS